MSGWAAGTTGPLDGVTTTWSTASRHAFNSYVEANRALLASFGMAPPEADGQMAASLQELAYRTADWEFERSADTRDELGVGEYVTFSKTLADGDVRAFAEASGDTNRLHLDEAFAEETRFRSRIAHGTLVSGLISAALARLPGMTIYLSQDVEFRGPVRIGDRATAICEIVEDLGDDRYRLTTRVEGPDEDVVVDGEAVVLIDEFPGDA